MSDQTPASASAPLPLPDAPSIDWLRKQAKRELAELRRSKPETRLSEAQFELAKRYGFASWRALKAHIDGLSIDGQIADAARAGDTARLAKLLDEHSEKTLARFGPYGHTLLHVAAPHAGTVAMLLRRGLDVNARERGDNTYAMHWAAAAGAIDAVRVLADAGGDVVGHGDDHELEVIGWATCWDGTQDAAHRAVADFLVSCGARHHIFSAIALDLDDEVRRIVADDPSALNRRMSHNENQQLPIHFALRMNRPRMLALLIQLGADPLGVDGFGLPSAAYATEPDVDRPLMEAIHTATRAELSSAARGYRATRATVMDLLAALALADWTTADQLVRENPKLIAASTGALHMMTKRNDVAAVRWLLAHGADPSGVWSHWEADLTALHLAALANHTGIARVLLEAGADPSIKDTRHDGDALDWARFFNRAELIQLLEKRGNQ